MLLKSRPLLLIMTTAGLTVLMNAAGSPCQAKVSKSHARDLIATIQCKMMFHCV
jgi:hypothetical protein